MRKLTVIFIFISLQATIFWLMVTLATDSINVDFLRLSLPRQEYQLKYGNLRLSDAEVQQITEMQKSDLSRLNQMKQQFQFTALAIVLLFLFGVYKTKVWFAPFDGLVLIIISLMLFNLHWMPLWLIEDFEGGPNATITCRIVISSVLLIIQPISFFLAYRWNQSELLRYLHKQKWISVFALSLTFITGLLALGVGIGILVTPDLSGNIT